MPRRPQRLGPGSPGLTSAPPRPARRLMPEGTTWFFELPDETEPGHSMRSLPCRALRRRRARSCGLRPSLHRRLGTGEQQMSRMAALLVFCRYRHSRRCWAGSRHGRSAHPAGADHQLPGHPRPLLERALRQAADEAGLNQKKIKWLFGPETEQDGDFGGALSVGDAGCRCSQCAVSRYVRLADVPLHPQSHPAPT